MFNQSLEALYKKIGVSGSFILEKENYIIQFDALPDLVINYDICCKLPITTAKNHQTDSHQTNLCITDEDNQNLTPSQKTLIHWHHRFKYKNCASIQQIFHTKSFTSRKFESVGRFKLPKYEICQYARAHRKPKRGNISTVDPITDGFFKKGHLRPCSGIYVDNFESRLKGRTYALYYKTTSDQYVGGCIFVDHISGYIHVKPQLGISSSETICAVINFKKLFLDN